VQRLAAVVAAALVLAAGASAAANPAQRVATQLKPLLQSALKKQYPTLKVTFTRITCALAKNGKSGKCAAYFQIPAARALGTFTIGLTIDPTTGKLKWRQLAAECVDSKTGQKLACF
jgi:hypothetical protein